jgi:hypothetical protein
VRRQANITGRTTPAHQLGDDLNFHTSMMRFRLPEWVILRIDKIRRNFLWMKNERHKWSSLVELGSCLSSKKKWTQSEELGFA